MEACCTKGRAEWVAVAENVDKAVFSWIDGGAVQPSAAEGRDGMIWERAWEEGDGKTGVRVPEDREKEADGRLWA